jgi:hypothetical protein
LLAQRLECWNDVLQHLIGGEEISSAVLRDRIVQMQDVGALKSQPFQTGVNHGHDCRANAAFCFRHTHLGAVDEVARLELPIQPAERLLGNTVAILRGCIEVVDTRVDCAREGALLVCL